MKEIIRKYQLSIADEQMIDLPYPAQMLHIDTEPEAPDTPVLWALHGDPDDDITKMKMKYPYVIRMMGTDVSIDRIDRGLEHISTIRIRGGVYVLHCFVEKV